MPVILAVHGNSLFTSNPPPVVVIGPPPPPPPATASANFTVDATSTYFNPDRGFYVFLGSFTTQTQSSVSSIRSNTGFTLGFCWVDLSAYKTQSIPQSFLDS